jgi:energy-coupling factor transporter ATP-binding protein EcfA2
VEPDLLIIDEALAAGDAAFALKCFDRVEEICKSGCTVLFVSHSGASVIRLCDRAVWIEDGELRMVGPALDVVRQYEYYSHGITLNRRENNNRPVGDGVNQESKTPELASLDSKSQLVANGTFSRGIYKITKIQFLNEKNEETLNFYENEHVCFRVWYKHIGSTETAENISTAFGIRRKSDKLLIANFSTNIVKDDQELASLKKMQHQNNNCYEGYFEAKFQMQISSGAYYISYGILTNNPEVIEFHELNYLNQEIVVLRAGSPTTGIFAPIVKWRHVQLDSQIADKNASEDLAKNETY